MDSNDKEFDRLGQRFDNMQRGITVWFVICAIVAIALLGGAVAGVIYLLPHLVGMIDRIGK